MVKRRLWPVRCAGFGIVVAILLGFSSPLYGAIQVLDGLFQETSLTSGETVMAGLRIHNPAKQPQTITLYQTDEKFKAGATSFPAAGTNERSNARWLQFKRQQWVVPAQTTVTVPYQINVPSDTQLRGTYWSVVMVQVLAAEPAQDASLSFTIRQTFRTAVRVVTQVVSEPPLVPTLKLNDSALTMNEEGVVGLDLELLNVGVVSLQLLIFAELIDSSGNRMGRFSPRQAQARLLPTHQARRRIDFPELAPGRYEVIAVAENHDGHVFGARYVLLIDAR